MVKIMQSKLLQPFRKVSINILNRPISYLGIHLSVIKGPGHLNTHIRTFTETLMAVLIIFKESECHE